MASKAKIVVAESEHTRARLARLLIKGTAAERRGAALILEVGRKKNQVSELFYEIGMALVELEKKGLWKSLGHASFADMLSAHDLFARTQAFKLMAIVRGLPLDAALQMGTEKSYALVRYAHATAAADTPALLLTQGITVDGAHYEVGDLSARQIRDEVARTRQNRTNARRDNARKSARELAERAAKTLTRWLSEPVKITPKRGPKGWMVDIEMSVAALEELRLRAH